GQSQADPGAAGVPPSTIPPGSAQPSASGGPQAGPPPGAHVPGGAPPPGSPPPGALQPAGGNQAMASLASRLPSSQPGTLFGIPLARLRDPGLEQKTLLIAGIALLASIVIPLSLEPFVLVGSVFYGLIWPLIAGAAYLLVAIAPPDIKQKVPPAALKWLPFG